MQRWGSSCHLKMGRLSSANLSSGCYNRLGAYKQQTFLPILEAEKSKIKVLADLVSGEGLLWLSRFSAVSSVTEGARSSLGGLFTRQ